MGIGERTGKVGRGDSVRLGLRCPRIGKSVGWCSRVVSVCARRGERQPEGMSVEAAQIELLPSVEVELDRDRGGE